MTFLDDGFNECLGQTKAFSVLRAQYSLWF